MRVIKPRSSSHDALVNYVDALYQLRETIYITRMHAARAVADGKALETVARLTALTTKLVCARNALLPAQLLAQAATTADPAHGRESVDELRVVTAALRGEMHEIGSLFQSATARFEGTDIAVFIQFIVEAVVAVGDLSVASGVCGPSAFAIAARRKP